MTAPPGTALPPGCLTDPAQPLTFTFEGRTISAVQGQSVAAALYAAGVRIFSRSFKYHRPRGLLCVSGDCPNCLMQVDRRANVRTCIEPVRQGQVVRGQNAWPGLRFDMLRVFDRLSYFLPVGFYYKRFHRPRWLWPVFERVVRSIAGLGRIDVGAPPADPCSVEHLHTPVCVIGGGPAGLAAAAAALQAGAEVLLLEREPGLGGHQLYEEEASPVVERLLRTLNEYPARVRVLLETMVFGLYEGNLVAASQRDRLLKIRAPQVIVCTGGRQRPFLFPNNDLPGIFLGKGALRLARLHGVRPGRRAVVMTDNDGGHGLAGQLAALGIEVMAIVDRRPGPVPAAPGPVLSASVVIRARGRSHLQAVQVGRVNGAGNVENGSERTIACDLLCLVPQLTPANELLYQGGMRFAYEDGCWRPARAVPGLLAAGAAAGTFELEAQLAEGQQHGLEAAAALGNVAGPESAKGAATPPTPTPMPFVDSGRATRGFAKAAALQSWVPNLQAGKSFVCLCEDVTTKDLKQAVDDGFDHIETLKRYTTVGMGPCQGKVCGQTGTEICAYLTHKEIGEVGTTTSRPPVAPVELAVLAAERRQHPVRRTPLHHWHQAAGARWLDTGQWKRPEHYGDPNAEVGAVRQNVGLIDVSTLGKIEIAGPEATELLERIYVNKWSDLTVGRVRYGVLCTEEGILFDDGVVAQLAPDRYYLTATTGNTEAVFQWLELWRATWRLQAAVVNQTAALAAMNLAGPRAREVLGRLTGLDLSPAGFPYASWREAEVAGVWCRLMRIGFVGELGYEIHCASPYAQHLWEALQEAGSDSGLKAFGVEAQRVLRLEKGHLIVGQDTDAQSDPLGAGLGRLVAFDKPQFHGRDPLLRMKAMTGRPRLVGFHIREGTAIADGTAQELEGCQVVEQGRSIGRVTSARYSPTLEVVLGLAWVPPSRAAAGTPFMIRFQSADLPAVVAAVPFFDPDGKRLKS
jgi:sarcosine oxidase subunit alpha